MAIRKIRRCGLPADCSIGYEGLHMVSSRLVLLLSVCVLAVCGCENSTPCALVKCDNGRVCDQATGACVAGDGGVKDAGTDAGTPDAGMDAGTTCVPACGAGLQCDLTTLRC